MAGADLKLLGAEESLFTCRIVWALKLKGVDYEFVKEDLSNKSPLLLQLNPIYKKVPVLLHHGKPICESLLILEYIDEVWKDHPILPQDPLHRAYARFWAKLVDQKFLEASLMAFHSSSGEEKAKGVESAGEVLELLEAEIKGKKFFGGEKVGFLDLVVGWIAYWHPFVEEVGGFKAVDSTKYPSFVSWIHNFLQLPLIRDSLPPPEALRLVFQGFHQLGLQK
ncbi:probable glutathione S-transferase [Diospyros lotus]|uniref:probable glutathione S-transferase n=1 Tax=Diospyros lotus TaxID=55363 RepID=UPI002259B057|nr:probable glutathione S-transferase [Diospyros lotus]